MTTYLRCLTFSVAAIFVIGAAINFVLDPVGYFRHTGWNVGPLAGERVWADERLTFALSIHALRPDTLIAGTSRVRHGFAMDNEELPPELGSTLRLGIRGARFSELEYYIRRVLDNGSLRHLAIGLDLGQFLRGDAAQSSVEKQTGHNAQGSVRPWVAGVTALWSRQAFLGSASIPFRPHPVRLDGSGNIEVMQRRVRARGHRELTRVFERRMAKTLPGFDEQIYTAHMAKLDALLAHACKASTDVRLFVSPLHARQLLLLRETARLDLFHEWKAALATLVDAHESGGCDVTLTDFSMVSSYTSESFPERGDKQEQMRWYWESSHYTYRLGQMIIDQLWKNGEGSPDFGRRLTASNRAELLAEEQRALQALIKEQPALAKEIRDLVR